MEPVGVVGDVMGGRESLFHHVPKGDLRPGSASDVNPPWAAFDVVHRMDYERVEAQLAAVLAETTRWQREAQTPEERAWANVHHANITRALREAT